MLRCSHAIRRPRRFRRASVAMAVVLVAGCSGSPGGQPSTVPSTAVSGVPTPSVATQPEQPTGPAGTLFVTERDNGRTLEGSVGEVVVASLSSTYWRFDPPPRGAVMTGDPVVTPAGRGSCLPGVGCGTVVARYRLDAAATLDLRAARSTCGEALPCPAERSAWVVHVRVR